MMVNKNLILMISILEKIIYLIIYKTEINCLIWFLKSYEF